MEARSVEQNCLCAMKTTMENNKENDANLCKSKCLFTLNAVCNSRHLNSEVDTGEMQLIL